SYFLTFSQIITHLSSTRSALPCSPTRRSSDLDLTDDPAQHRQIADRGAYLAFDTVGKSSYQSDSTRVRLVLALLEQGLESHLMLSNDISRFAYLHSHGGQGYGHVLGPFATALRQAG